MSSRVSLTSLLEDCKCLALNSVRLRTLFTLLLQHLYTIPCHADGFGDALACLQFDPENPKKGDLQIGPSHVIDKDSDQFIRIAVKNSRFEQRYIGNQAGFSEDEATDYLAKHVFATLAIRHAHPNPDIALLMAESSLTFLEAMKKQLLENVAGLLNLNCEGLGEVITARPEPISREVVDLTVSVEYQLVIAVSEESHRLKKIDLTLRAI